MTAKIYGIKNCDTMKKAMRWLDEQSIGFEFHDYKKMGADAQMLEEWCNKADWQVLLNKAGTTFRKLPDEDKQSIDQAKAIALMSENPSMIKRPVLELNGKIYVGFKPDNYTEIFG